MSRQVNLRYLSDSENKAPEILMKSEEGVESSEDASLNSDSNPTSPDQRKRRRTNHDYRRLSSSGYTEEVYGDYKQRYSSESSDLSLSPVRQRSKSLGKSDERDTLITSAMNGKPTTLQMMKLRSIVIFKYHPCYRWLQC